MELCEVFVLGGRVGLGGPHKSTDLWVYVVWGCLCMPPILLNHLGSKKKEKKGNMQAGGLVTQLLCF